MLYIYNDNGDPLRSTKLQLLQRVLPLWKDQVLPTPQMHNLGPPVQGYLAHLKLHPPSDHHRALGISLP